MFCIYLMHVQFSIPIGQSIIRNLTTSPFSQKKHSLQQQQIDPLWRMPNHQDVAAVAFDNCDSALPHVYKSGQQQSPVLANRKRFQETLASTSTITYPQQQQPSLIPVNKNDSNIITQRTPGNQSPIGIKKLSFSIKKCKF